MEDRRLDPAETAAPSLRAAMRLARVDEAERSLATAELRGAELARLEMLHEALAPVLAQVPDDVEMIDCGILPGSQPRLFVDMIAFVELAHDKRRYRFIQATRHGRAVLAESERIEAMVDAITTYIARRLVDREKALASAERCGATAVGSKAAEPPVGASASPPKTLKRRGWAAVIGHLLLEYLGIIALCVLIVVMGRYAYFYWESLQH